MSGGESSSVSTFNLGRFGRQSKSLLRRPLRFGDCSAAVKPNRVVLGIIVSQETSGLPEFLNGTNVERHLKTAAWDEQSVFWAAERWGRRVPLCSQSNRPTAYRCGYATPLSPATSLKHGRIRVCSPAFESPRPSKSRPPRPKHWRQRTWSWSAYPHAESGMLCSWWANIFRKTL